MNTIWLDRKAANVDEWLDANTFYCKGVRARISHQQCQALLSRPPIMRAHPDTTIPLRPFACDECAKNKGEDVSLGRCG